MIEVKDLVKKYDDHLAVDHLNFTVEKGQILGFLGPNGAGKSTTMNIITGYLSATSGSVTINGHDIYEEPEEAKKCIGYLPEQPPVYMDMTVNEYLTFAAELKGVPKQERKTQIAQVMDQTKTTEVAGRLIKHLSKGYRQRIGIAQALLGNPEVIILDEPTVGLDPMQIIEIRDLMKELAQEHTVILSSHILSEISAVCDTVMIINKGKLIVSDRAENLSRHLNAKNGCRLVIKGGEEDVLQAVGTVSGITETEVEKTAPAEGQTALTVYSPADMDIREELFFTLAEAKLPILEMQMKTMNLEDIFLELTKEDAENAAESAVAAGEENAMAAEKEDTVAVADAESRNGEDGKVAVRASKDIAAGASEAPAKAADAGRAANAMAADEKTGVEKESEVGNNDGNL